MSEDCVFFGINMSNIVSAEITKEEEFGWPLTRGVIDWTPRGFRITIDLLHEATGTIIPVCICKTKENALEMDRLVKHLSELHENWLKEQETKSKRNDRWAKYLRLKFEDENKRNEC
jgi:hypothetical protein